MTHEISKDVGFAMDNTAGTLVDLSGSINSLTVDGGQNLLEDTGMGDTRVTLLPGLANASTVQVNGFHNSTTRAIVMPLVDRTSVTKTIEVKLATGDYWTGEAWPEAVQGLSASPNSINAWSITFRAQNGLTQTSVTAVA